jgi:hypothetical protein
VQRCVCSANKSWPDYVVKKSIQRLEYPLTGRGNSYRQLDGTASYFSKIDFLEM